ncbi:DUF2586 family protein [Flavobacterium kingsejongi]|uniref:Phage tail protein n=1 Tax=Flavobacterium kingsejongi TaxID=1678728 RepID=A0A2S1LM24_9FLAO|nr:DUF2586 family protein [Flavobacterium kingsejongi]AWG24820.1 hypothetical protein FK004_06045 [Flavobacterium kingsejongi]
MAQGTGTPGVTVAVTSGNLQRPVPVLDGIAGIMGTAYTVANIGVVKTVYGYDDAVEKGYTPELEPFLNKQLREFYNELGGTQEVWVLGVEDTMLLKDMVSTTNANGLKKLLAVSRGRVNMPYICRKPDATYTPPVAFLDKDVSDAVTASKALCQYQQKINQPIRLLIEGRVVDVDQANTFMPATASNTYVGVVLGGSLADGSASGSVALARAIKYGAHVKIGNGQNGALTITPVFIGDRPLEEFFPEELDNLSDAGYIIFHHRDGAAGYYFGIDKMAGNDDFEILAYGRMMDKVQRIATATSMPFVETSVRMNPDGTINDADAQYLEDLIKTAILAGTEAQLSAVDVIIPTAQNIINTSTLSIQVKIQPLGYLTWINITMGLTTNL